LNDIQRGFRSVSDLDHGRLYGIQKIRAVTGGVIVDLEIDVTPSTDE